MPTTERLRVRWRLSRPEAGETLIEVVVAVTLIAILLIPAMNMLIGSGTISDTVQDRSTATYLATQEVEAIRAQAETTGAGDGAAFWSSIDSQLGQSGPITLSVDESRTGGINYTATNTLEWVGQGEDLDECGESGASAPQLLQVRSNVSWPGPGPGGSASEVTDLAPPPGAFSSNTTGDLGVAVEGAGGEPMPGVAVTVAEADGSNSQTQATGSDGCAFFAYLPTTQTWNVTASAPGDVSNQETSSATLSQVSLADGTTTNETLLLDRAASVLASVTPSGPTPVAGGLTYSVGSAQLAGSIYSFPVLPGTAATAGPVGPPASLSPLFPYTSGYVVFAGSCTDSDPAGEQGNTSGLSFYDAPVTQTVVNPGATTPAAVQLGTLTVTVTVNNAPTAGATVTATPVTPTNSPGFGSNIDWTCSRTPIYTLANSSGAAATSTTLVPYGHYVVTAESGGVSATQDVWVAQRWLDNGQQEPAGEYQLDSSGAPVVPPASPGAGPIAINIP